VHQPPAHLGVPIAVFLCEECNQPIIDADLNRKIVDLFEREGAEAGTRRMCRSCCRQRPSALTAAGRHSEKKRTFSTFGLIPA